MVETSSLYCLSPWYHPCGHHWGHTFPHHEDYGEVYWLAEDNGSLCVEWYRRNTGKKIVNTLKLGINGMFLPVSSHVKNALRYTN